MKLIKLITGIFKRKKEQVTIITRGGVIQEVKGNVMYKIKDYDEPAALCMTCGLRDDGETDRCRNGHDNWLGWEDVSQENEHYQLALKQSGLTPEKFKKLFYDNKHIHQLKQK